MVFQTTSGTTSWRYPLALSNLPDGPYVVSVRATDTVGNTTAQAQALTASFGIDTIAPPAPVITGAPDNPTFQTQAELHFTDTEQGVTFRCQLDERAATACSGGAEYENLAVGNHCFNAVAVDGAANAGARASVCWTVGVNNSLG